MAPRTSKLPKQTGATTHAIGMYEKLMAYLRHHKQAGLETLHALLSSWFTSLMTWLVIGIAMALPAILYVLLNNLETLGGDWRGNPRISLYLKTDARFEQAETMRRALEVKAFVRRASLISPDDALQAFQLQSGFGKVLQSLPRNPLPWVIEIEPERMTSAALELQLVKLKSLPLVAAVSADLAWVERLFTLIALAERFIAALWSIFALGVLLSIGNTIRLAIESRKSEVEVVKLVGGTDRFVRRPFLYLGFWYGLGGALMAWLMLQAGLTYLSGAVEQLMDAYQRDYSLVGLGLGESIILLLSGALLGVLGAMLAVARHLYHIEPS